MTKHTPIFALICATLILSAAGCAVSRDQESVGAYIDDAAITTAVKARYIDNAQVDANAISVETLHGTVLLSGFAKNNGERAAAETLAWKVKGVKQVKNEVAVRP
jgi:osmotically-inducible protein OsmY